MQALSWSEPCICVKTIYIWSAKHPEVSFLHRLRKEEEKRLAEEERLRHAEEEKRLAEERKREEEEQARITEEEKQRTELEEQQRQAEEQKEVSWLPLHRIHDVDFFFF